MKPRDTKVERGRLTIKVDMWPCTMQAWCNFSDSEMQAEIDEWDNQLLDALLHNATGNLQNLGVKGPYHLYITYYSHHKDREWSFALEPVLKALQDRGLIPGFVPGKHLMSLTMKFEQRADDGRSTLFVFHDNPIPPNGHA